MLRHPLAFIALGLLATNCGSDHPHDGPGATARSPMAAAVQPQESFNDRVRRLTQAAPTAVTDSMMRNRVRIVALSDDPQICAHLNAGEGLRDSSTVFALMAGAASDSYVAGARVQDVINSAMGFSRLGPVATVTAQLLDASCHLVKPADAADTQEVATAGRIHFRPEPSGNGATGRFEITLRDEAAPVAGDYAATACPGLLTSIVSLIPVPQAEEGQATALKCVD